MSTTLVRIDNDVWTAFKQLKPKYLTDTGFLSQTLDDHVKGVALQGTVYLQGLKNSTAEEQPAVDVKPKAEPINKEKTTRAKSPRASSPLLTTFLKS